MANSETTTTPVDQLVFKHPSEAYRHAIETPIYRLSELMFGGLLAAYVLGFITFAFGTVADLSANDIFRSWNEFSVIGEHLLLRAPYLFISVTYAYITAGIYVSYHTGILTMPHMPLKQLSLDFLLALTPAIFFGASMLYPFLFPTWLAVVLFLAAIRQYGGYRQLTKWIHDTTTSLSRQTADSATYDDEMKKGVKNLRRHFADVIKKYGKFSGWRRSPQLVLIFAFVLLFLNLVMWFIVWQWTSRPELSTTPNQGKNLVVCLFSFVMVAIIGFYAHWGLGERAGLLYMRIHTKKQPEGQTDDTAAGKQASEATQPKILLDTQYDQLVADLRQIILKYDHERDST